MSVDFENDKQLIELNDTDSGALNGDSLLSDNNNEQSNKEIGIDQHSLDQKSTNSDNEVDDDSDFGSFDEAYVEATIRDEGSIPQNEHDSRDKLDYSNKEDQPIDEIIAFSLKDLFITTSNEYRASERDDDIAMRGSKLFQMISSIPRLKPSNWTQSKIRRELLVNLKIPINLDELGKNPTLQATTSSNTHRRRRTITKEDLDWDALEIPDVHTLNLSGDDSTILIESTENTLSRIERDILANTSKQFLMDPKHEAFLDDKISQLSKDREELVKLASVWKNQLRELVEEFEIYETVVQNLIGYSQKVRREELIENLEKVKHQGRKKHRLKGKSY